MNTPDLLDTLGAFPESVSALRDRRIKVKAATQASLEALLSSDLESLSVAERLQVAVLACRLSGSSLLAKHYVTLALAEGVAPEDLAGLEAKGEPWSNGYPTRLATILQFTATLVQRPLDGDRIALERLLTEAGLTISDCVVLAQLVGFLTYQIRLLAGLRAMAAVERDA